MDSPGHYKYVFGSRISKFETLRFLRDFELYQNHSRNSIICFSISISFRNFSKLNVILKFGLVVQQRQDVRRRRFAQNPRVSLRTAVQKVEAASPVGVSVYILI